LCKSDALLRGCIAASPAMSLSRDNAQHRCAASLFIMPLNRLTAKTNAVDEKSLRHRGLSLECGRKTEAMMNDQTMPGAAQPIDMQPMQRLAERLTSLVPPSVATPVLPPPSPGVAAALARSTKLANDAAKRARRAGRPSLIGIIFSLPYSLVALALRLVIARVFFLDGQVRIEGPRFAFGTPPLDFQGFGIRGLDFSVILPMQAKVTTVVGIFDYLGSAMLSTIIAYALVYAEFVLPIMLVLGLGTRFVALALIAVTVLMQMYIAPQALWTAHIYWASILVVLVSLGAGKISIDQIVRMVARR
jgi:putative oxidoreductase